MKGAEKDALGREVCDLVLSASMSAGDVPIYTQVGALDWDQGRILKKRINHDTQHGRKLFPTYLFITES